MRVSLGRVGLVGGFIHQAVEIALVGDAQLEEPCGLAGSEFTSAGSAVSASLTSTTSPVIGA